MAIALQSRTRHMKVRLSERCAVAKYRRVQDGDEMKRLSMAAAALAIAGCTSSTTSLQTEYSYESKAHSGQVTVLDTVYSSDDQSCNGDWREAKAYMPRGLYPHKEDITFAFKTSSTTSGEKSAVLDEFRLSVPVSIGHEVLAKDRQVFREYMLAAEHNGLVSQGDFFIYPEGFYYRVSDAKHEDGKWKACIGVDYTYVRLSDLESGATPPIFMDRVVVPFSVEKQDTPVSFTFGRYNTHTLEIRAFQK